VDTDGDSTGRDLYAVLGLDPEATMEDIRRAFRTMAARNHPDKHPGDPKAALRFKRINAAFQVLSDPKRKRQYDNLTTPIEELAHAPSAVAADSPAREEIPGGIRRRRVRRKPQGGIAWALVVIPIAFMVVALAIPEAKITGVGESSSSTVPSQAPARGTTSPEPPVRPRVSIPTSLPVPIPVQTSALSAQLAPSRAIAGDRWTFALPPDWQEISNTAPNAKARRWSPPGDGSSPSVELEVSTLAGEPAAYFDDLKTERPAAESWETVTKPDGLRREGRVENGDVLLGRFVEYAIASKGRGYRLTCAAPPQIFDVALCERILGTLRIR
jgi:curved DNA-binding protein CbpA